MSNSPIQRNINKRRLPSEGLNMKFGRLTLLRIEKDGSYNFGIYHCDCGQETKKLESHVYNGAIKSCGCLRLELKVVNKTHGMTKTKEFRAFGQMINRCTNANYKYYRRYGGRGIVVCDRWRNSFENFFQDLGNAPSPTHSLDRLNNDGNYEPNNCRWATQKEQMNNYSKNSWITYNDSKMTLSQWALDLGISASALYGRIKRGASFNEIYKKFKK